MNKKSINKDRKLPRKLNENVRKGKITRQPMSYEDALKKYGNDVTKIPGNSRGKRVQ